ncbi:hypothetical protein [Siphonobacter sp. SORGH_AS_1065]|uniref:hypothetical protein n=1 Tax=Siphonobacter sp. SORGH_AS_1065 TaxID=3041795 RepID=UPI00277F9389|nr:hypothetical protein [Siphonobacter sp. SORGH_AS_1065]MDQ1086174.1 hypothetical protein [Siphonobacter sp. SORGH_AS_1065]
MKNIYAIWLSLLATTLSNTLLLAQASKEDVSKIVNTVSYGVPTSPAFELLPGKTSEVVNLSTPQDFATQIPSIYDGKKLKTGTAFDLRIFTLIPTKKSFSLTDYQENKGKRALWRSVFSLGTASDQDIKNDALLSCGIRIPILDKSDPRANSSFLSELINLYNNINIPLEGIPGSIDGKNYNELIVKALSKGLDSIRNSYFKRMWNAEKFDVGLAYMLRAKSSILTSDSIKSDKYGLWAAYGRPLFHSLGQITISGKITRSFNQVNSELEQSRYVVGARARFFPGIANNRLAASIEFANIWSDYQGSHLNENWRHTAILVEYHLPVLKGWLGIAYGGDTPHRTNSGSKFSLSYAIYTNQLIKK